MYLKILRKDIMKKKVITIAVSIFIILSAFLVASGTNMIITLLSSLDTMFVKANAPHFVQYHAGDLDQEIIDIWTKKNSYVKTQQTSKMLNIHGSNIYFADDIESKGYSVMEFMFVKQNESFDFLLDLKSQKIELEPGEIGVPIYFMQKNNLAIGDKIHIINNNISQSFEIKSFVRDAQMNPSFVSSKRFVVSNQDFEMLGKFFSDVEHQIAFILKNKDYLPKFSNSYSMSELPNKGPTINVELLKVSNSLTDGLVFAVIFIISLLLNLIAVLCLRFTILSTLEEDCKEIGVMKAIGFQQKQIKKVYMTKYMAITAMSCIIGYLLSLELNSLFLKNILLYIGYPELGALKKLIPLVATGFVFIFIIAFCNITLNKFKKISTVDALRKGKTGDIYKSKKIFSLYNSKRLNVNVYLGLKDVLLRIKAYTLLFLVYVICVFIIVVPLNFYSTAKSEEFITYMGMGYSDILIDLRQTEDIQVRYESVLKEIEKDKDVIKYSPLVTSKFEAVSDDGTIETLLIETGDFTIFPLKYSEGYAPVLRNEIALSYLNARDFDKRVGDTIDVIIDGIKTPMLVTGIYQDVTNGGKTAKANIKPNYESASWYMISISVNGEISEKMDEYTRKFSPAKVTDVEGYFHETFGNTVDQLLLLTKIATVIAVVVAIMITSLFMRMLIAKDYSQILIMRSIGFSLKNIRTQYITRAMLVLNSGIVLGAIMSNTLGQSLISKLLSIVGASNISFVINPFAAYVLCPLLLITVVSLSIWISSKPLKLMSITDLQVE